ncbi:hypothetical protein [Micromonospora halophytica]|uniref:Uncharacterized protein n=1 Tax=Micromonospora halophytica TaxID=47864 RepID=A0A1C5J5G8_9ACTN|nr:hypothetical protein [Micromonospora halophytica]SCG65429.1 hypothetical protein GA0070560_12179 [Micromonospora halophytica]
MARPTYEWRPPERPWEEQDLSGLPEDGNRYEIIDGSLHVTPPAGPEHHEIGVRVVHYHLVGAIGPDYPVQIDEPWSMRLDPSVRPR